MKAKLFTKENKSVLASCLPCNTTGSISLFQCITAALPQESLTVSSLAVNTLPALRATLRTGVETHHIFECPDVATARASSQADVAHGLAPPLSGGQQAQRPAASGHWVGLRLEQAKRPAAGLSAEEGAGSHAPVTAADDAKLQTAGDAVDGMPGDAVDGKPDVKPSLGELLSTVQLQAIVCCCCA